MRPFFQTAVLALPLNGRLTLPIELDFTAIDSHEFDLAEELMDVGGIGFVQGVFVDNGRSGDPLTLRFFNPANQGYVLRIPGMTETWQPVLLPSGSCRFTATGAVRAGKRIEIGLVNFPVQPIMWNTP